MYVRCILSFAVGFTRDKESLQCASPTSQQRHKRSTIECLNFSFKSIIFYKKAKITALRYANGERMLTPDPQGPRPRATDSRVHVTN